jgi:hypothetical protein
MSTVPSRSEQMHRDREHRHAQGLRASRERLPSCANATCGWIEVENPGYWRRDQELQALRRSLEQNMP